MRYSTNKKAAGATQAAILYRHSKLTNKSGFSQAKFDKSALCSPAELLNKLAIKYHKSGDRLQVYCPFHKSGREQSPSLVMHSVDGHFRCHACGAKGFDAIKFYQQLTNSSFKEAVYFMGAKNAR